MGFAPAATHASTRSVALPNVPCAEHSEFQTAIRTWECSKRVVHAVGSYRKLLTASRHPRRPMCFGMRPSQVPAMLANPAERVPAAIMSTARAGKACLLVPRRAAQRSRDAKMAAGLSRWESERWNATCQGTLPF